MERYVLFSGKICLYMYFKLYKHSALIFTTVLQVSGLCFTMVLCGKIYFWRKINTAQ